MIISRGGGAKVASVFGKKRGAGEGQKKGKEQIDNSVWAMPAPIPECGKRGGGDVAGRGGGG